MKWLDSVKEVVAEAANEASSPRSEPVPATLRSKEATVHISHDSVRKSSGATKMISLNVPADFLAEFDGLWREARIGNRTQAILMAMRTWAMERKAHRA